MALLAFPRAVGDLQAASAGLEPNAKGPAPTALRLKGDIIIITAVPRLLVVFCIGLLLMEINHRLLLQPLALVLVLRPVRSLHGGTTAAYDTAAYSIEQLIIITTINIISITTIIVIITNGGKAL